MVLSKTAPNWSTQLIDYYILQLMFVLACFNNDCNATYSPTPPTIFKNRTLPDQMPFIAEMTNTAATYTKRLIPGKGRIRSLLAHATNTAIIKDMLYPTNSTFTGSSPQDWNSSPTPPYYPNEFPNRIFFPYMRLPKDKQTATIIWMHSVGDNGLGWSAVIKDFSPPQVKVICPIANKISFTMNRGLGMQAWFDMEGFKENSPEDLVGIEKAAKYVHSLVEHETKGNHIQSDRIILGGFGQGAALALYSAFTCPHTLAGVVSLSGWLPLRKNITKYAHDANRNISVLQCQGDLDVVLADELPQKSAEFMKLVSPNVDFKIYQDLPHETCEEELEDVKKFFIERLPPITRDKEKELRKLLTGRGAFHF